MKHSFTKIYTSLLAITAFGLTTTSLLAQTFPVPPGPPTSFTLPAGKSIVITYEVDVNACPAGSVAPANISNQASVSGSNFATVLTDEVAGAPVTPTLTPFAALTLGNLVFNDLNRNGVFDGMEAGIDGVAINLYLDNGDNVLTVVDGAAIATTMTAGGGLYSFNVCPGSYIVEIALSNFTGMGVLANGGAPFVSSPISGAPDPDNFVDNDDNGDAVSGFGIASQAITIVASNATLDFGLKTPATITIGDVTMNEGTGGTTTSFDFTVTRSSTEDAINLTVNTSHVTTGASDFTAISGGMVSFAAAGNLTATVSVLVNHDAVVEPNEIFNVVLSGAPAHATLTDDTGAGTITNDDTDVSVAVSPSSVLENGGTNLVYTFTRTGVTTGALTVNFSVGGTADFGTDYTQSGAATFSAMTGTVTFGAGNPTTAVTIDPATDQTVENDETVVLTVTSGAGYNVAMPSVATGTITNDELDFGDAPDPTYPTLLASNGARHTAFPGIRLGASIDAEANGQPNAGATGDGADEDGVTLPASLVTGTNASITVNASVAGFLNAWVDFNANGSFGDPGEQVFTNTALVPGNNPMSFAVPGGALPGASFARFRFGTQSGVSFNGLATDGEVEDYQVQIVNTQFSINDPVVTEGTGGSNILVFTVTRTNNASACAVDFALTGGTALPPSDFTLVTASPLNFTAGGSTTASIVLQLVTDNIVELNETVDMMLSNPVNGTITDGNGTGTITNDDVSVVSVSNPSLTEGGNGTSTMTFNVALSKPSDAAVSVDYITMDGTAQDENGDGDYQSTNGNHLFTPGQTSKQVMVAINGDCDIESGETFKVRLSNLVNNGRAVSMTGGGPTADGIGTIQNDDALPVITCPADYMVNNTPGICSATVTLTLPALSSLCGNSTLEFRYQPLDENNNPTGPFSAWTPSANNVLTLAAGNYKIEWQVTDASGISTCMHFVSVNDNELPVALCQNLSLPLDATGNLAITPAQVNNGSTDNCAIELVSLSLTSFSCSNIGPNNVTLTVTDESNNTSTCTATVTIEPFVTIASIVVTDESCAGAANGTITINATTVGGTLVYSITGGSSYQGSNVFNNLSPGAYNIKMLAQGTSGCTATGTATVTAGPAATTWYKDLDNDGYTDGITQVSCPQPAGFVASAPSGDCNDNDPLKFPGQTWYKDTDNDGWSNGTTLVQCNRPVGYKAASELTGTSGDCNDSNAAVNPGATEICNGIDDDCDGQIDEGTTGNQTYVGNVTFTTQAQVNAFSQCYNKIQGILTIQGTGINSLAPLSNLIEVTSNMTIKFTSLPNMNGLNALATIGGSLTIQSNIFGAHLTSLDGLEALTSIGNNLVITTNIYLSDCCSIEALLANAGVGGSILISGNAFGCQSVAQINTACSGGSIMAPPNTGISQFEQLEAYKMTLFPNPASGKVTIGLQGLSSVETTLTIFDELGRTVLVQRLAEGQNSVTLDLNDGLFRNGIYLVSAVMADDQRLTQRLVVAR